MNLYQENSKILYKRGVADPNEIFDYQGDPAEEDFQKIFDFYTGNLNHFSKYGCQPSYFIFRQEVTLNALARKRNNNYLIGINQEVIRILFTKYQAYFNLIELPGLEKYSGLESILTNNLHDLLYQSILHFKFYHEFGHLLQFKTQTTTQVNLNGSNGIYDRDSHIAEIDADIVAVYNCCSHFSQYLHEHTRNALTKDQIEQFVSVMLGGILVYVVEFLDDLDKFYLREGKYPHPASRVCNLMKEAIYYFEHVQKMRGVDADKIIDKIKVGRESKDIISILMSHFHLSHKFNRIYDDINGNTKAIAEYVLEIVDEIKNDPNSAVNVRNKGI